MSRLPFVIFHWSFLEKLPTEKVAKVPKRNEVEIFCLELSQREKIAR